MVCVKTSTFKTCVLGYFIFMVSVFINFAGHIGCDLIPDSRTFHVKFNYGYSLSIAGLVKFHVDPNTSVQAPYSVYYFVGLLSKSHKKMNAVIEKVFFKYGMCCGRQ